MKMAKGMVGTWISIAMGIVILLADLYWLYIAWSGSLTTPVMLGIIILLADLVWLYTDR